MGLSDGWLRKREKEEERFILFYFIFLRKRGREMGEEREMSSLYYLDV